MEEISSQNSDLGLEDLDKLEAKDQAENTKTATSWGIKKFLSWAHFGRRILASKSLQNKLPGSVHKQQDKLYCLSENSFERNNAATRHEPLIQQTTDRS